MNRKRSTPKHLETIWSDLAPRMSDEYANVPLALAGAKSHFRSLVDRGVAHTLYSIDGRPIAILTWQDDAGRVATSFAATDEFFTPSYIRPFRRYMDEFQALRHNQPIVCYSHSTHPDVPHWFRFLRFTLESQDGLHRVFVRAPR